MPTNFQLHLLPILPIWLALSLGLLLLGLLALGSRTLLRKQVPTRWVRILAALRISAVVVFVVALLQPMILVSRSIDKQPELAVLIDTSRSMSQASAAQSGDRLEQLTTMLGRGELAATLAKRYRLQWFAFDRTAYPLEESELAGLQATGTSTHYSDSLTAVWNQLQARGIAPRRVLLASDGGDLGRTDAVETAQRLGLIVDTLAPGAAPAADQPAIVSIAEVQSAQRVLLGSETHFRVGLRSASASKTDRPFTLRLTEDGEEIWKQDIHFPAGKTEERVAVAYRPTEVGTKHYQFQLAAGDAKADAKADAPGSTYPLSVQVVDNKDEVLILEDTWRWDFKYLRRVLEDDPSFRFTALLARGGGAYVQFGDPQRRNQLGGFPQSRAEIAGFDTFILGDSDPRHWPRGLASAIAELVTEEGKSLVLIAGPNLANLAQVPELNTLLPVELSPESANPLAGPIEVRMSKEGSQSPFFFQTDASGATLPALDQIYPPLRKRPAATVLLEAAQQGNAYGSLIVMAEQTVGRGRVLYIGTDTLWKWQTLAAAKEGMPTPYALFWQHALRALAPVRAGGGSVQLWVQPERSRYEAGRPIAVHVELQSERPLAQPRLEATVLLPDGRRLPLAFAADTAKPDLFHADFESNLPGQYRVTASVAVEGKTLANGTSLIEVTPAPSEQASAPVDRANLARISSATGGQLLDPANPDTWPPGEESTSQEVTQTLDLWNSFALVLVLCGILGTDWLLRLLRGYA